MTSQTVMSSLLDVTVDGDGWRAGPSDHAPQGRLFGGQVGAQALAAAQQTIAYGMAMHSVHCVFLRAGDPTKAVRYDVERLHDGRSFATRIVRAQQDGRTICLITCSAHAAEPGPEHARPAPYVPRPDQVDPTADEDGFHTWHRAAWPDWDFQRVCAPSAGTDEARQQVWLRHREQLPDEPALQLRALLYASDMTLLGCASRRYHDRPLQTASLDHLVRFVRPARVDEWLLYDQRSPSAAAGRTVISGALYDLAGRLVALSQQEALLRPLPGG